MALFKIKRGLAANLPTTYVEGYCYVTTDDGKFYIDTSNAASGRIVLNAAKADSAGKWTAARKISISSTAGTTGTNIDGSAAASLIIPATMTGFSSITTNKLIVGTTSAAAHIQFQRESYNYLVAPKNGTIAFSPGSAEAAGDSSGVGAHLAVTYGAVIPGQNNNVVNLGSSSYKWKNVYATTFTGSLSGNASTATRLANTRTFTTNLASTTPGSFDGSANVTVGVTGVLPLSHGGTDNNLQNATKGSIVYMASDGSGMWYSSVGTSGQLLTSGGNGAPTWTTATNSNTASAVVKRDGNGNFSAGTITATLSGNASTASKWATARNLTIGAKAKSVDGSTNVSWSWNEIGVQRSKALAFTNTSYKTFVIPLCELTNTNASADFFFHGSIYAKRNNILSDWLTRLDIECGKQYNTTNPIYHITVHGGSGTKWTPVTFTYNSIKYFGVKCVVTGAGYEGSANCYAAGYATNWDIIEYTPIYNNNTSTIINEEIYNSLVELSGTTNVAPMIAFHDIRPRETEVFNLGADTYKWNAVYAKTLYGNGANITGLNASNINAGTLAAARLPASGVTAGTYGLDAPASPAFGATFLVPKIVVDTTGRITAANEYNITLPSLSLITAASTTATANAAATNGNVYLNLVSNSAVLNTHRLVCSGPLTITSDASGNITFANTAYTKTQVDTNISTAINNLVNAAPGALDTLDELAAALGDDANFATTVTNLIGAKVGSVDASGTAPLTLTGSIANGKLTLRGSVANATTSAAGVVTTSTQSFAGEKTFQGSVKIRTNAGSYPLVIQRTGDSEATKIYQDDSTLYFDMINDETTCTTQFKYSATDTEGSDGTNAHTATITMGMNSSGATYVTAGTFNGALAASNITGTLSVSHGGTGLSTLTSGYALIGNGTSAVSLRAITNNTTQGPSGWSTSVGANLITHNTLAYWNGAYTGTNSNISVVGTITTGTWNATTIAVSKGGTGNTAMTANRLVWSESASKLTAGYHYASSTKVAINSTSAPTETFYVNGTAKINGALTATSLNLTSFAKTLTLSANTWTDTGIAGENLSTGTYVIQIERGGEYYSGVMSWTTGKDTSPSSTEGYDEIVLHNAGSAAGSVSHIMARTVRTTSGIKLQICGTVALTSYTINIKCAKII